MRAIELKIGDWVLVRDVMTDTDTAARVKALPGGNLADIEGMGERLARELSPVPLTEGTLERNLWHRGPGQGVWSHMQGEWSLRAYRLCLGEDRAWSVELEFEGNYTHLRLVRHVHELQHLLWALGMDDGLTV